LRRSPSAEFQASEVCLRISHSAAATDTKNPGAVLRPGTLREFQFPEYHDLIIHVKVKIKSPIFRSPCDKADLIESA
jgi:hypothetical protein